MVVFSNQYPQPGKPRFSRLGVLILVYDERMLAWSMGCRPSLSDGRPFRALFPLGVLILVYDERMLAWSMGCRPSLSDDRPFRASARKRSIETWTSDSPQSLSFFNFGDPEFSELAESSNPPSENLPPLFFHRDESMMVGLKSSQSLETLTGYAP